MTRTRGCLGACVVAVIAFAFSSAEAKPSPTRGQATRGQTPPASAATSAPSLTAPASSAEAAPEIEIVTRHGKKIFRFHKAWVIPGSVQRPRAFYFLARTQVDYTWVKPQRSFTRRIVDAVRADVF
ncbi:MAG: hypothetical protein KAI47_11760 [Deltaproteobacteria bacterium]|nr:hypothetical protein [Deltaproteobacteria bacterium]